MLVGDEPCEGLYAARLIRGGPFVSVRIWREPAGWYVEIDGQMGDDVMSVWPGCARHPISKGEYEFLKQRAMWARDNQPSHPVAHPRRRVDLRKIPPVRP